MANFARMLGLTMPRLGRGGAPTGSRNAFDIEEEKASGLGYQGLTEGEKFRLSNRYRRKRGYDSDKSDQGGLGAKDIIAAQQKESKLQFDKEKEFVGKWTDLVLKAREVGDIALQKHLISYGREYIDTLSYGTRQLLEPLLRAGPFDPAKAKLEKYDQYNPMPQITADREKEPLVHAQQTFDQEDAKNARSHFVTGQTGPKRSIIPAGGKEGNYYIRDKDGRVSVTTETDLQVKDFAKEFGVLPGEVIANNGAFGKPVKTVINGVQEEFKPFTSFPDKVTSLQKTSGRTSAQVDENERKLADFLAIVKSGDEKLIKKHPLANMVGKQMESDSGFQTVVPELERAFPGYTFVKPKDPAGFWSEVLDLVPGTGNRVKDSTGWMQGGFVESDSGSIRAIPGRRVSIDLGNGSAANLIYNERNDMLYETTDGTAIGKYDDAVERLRIKSEKNKEEQEKEKEKQRRTKTGIASISAFMHGSSEDGESY